MKSKKPSRLIALLIIGITTLASGQHTPAVSRETAAVIDQIVGERLAEHTDRIASLEQRVGYLERMSNNGNASNQGSGQQTVHHQPNPQQQTHIIRSGDTLNGIARTYRVTVSDLAYANGITSNSTIYVGDVLKIPRGGGSQQHQQGYGQNQPPRAERPQQHNASASSIHTHTTPGGTYTVRSGDTLSRIATMHGTTSLELQRLNQLSDPDRLVIGQQIYVPGSAGNSATGGAYHGNGHGAPPATTAKEEDYHYYEIAPGDTLTSIAQTFFTSTAELERLNGLRPNQPLKSGGQLMVPTKRYFEYLRNEGVI